MRESDNFVGLMFLIVRINLVGFQNVCRLTDIDYMGEVQERVKQDLFTYKQPYAMHPEIFHRNFMSLVANCEMLEVKVSEKMLMQ